MSSLVADAVREHLESIRERAVAAVVSEDIALHLMNNHGDEIVYDPDDKCNPRIFGLLIRSSLRLQTGEWFIVDARGDILKLNGDRKRVVQVCLTMRAAGVIG